MIEDLKQIADDIASSKMRLINGNQLEEAKRLEYVEINLRHKIAELEEKVNNIFF